MSGRKGGEVLTVIRQNKQIIESEEIKIKKSINSILNNIIETKNECTILQKEILSTKIELGKNIEVFPEEVKQIQNEIFELQKYIKSMRNDEFATKNINDQCDSSHQTLQKLLNEGELLRSMVSSHYQDSNYSKARDIQNKINNTISQMYKIVEQANKIYNQSKSKQTELKNILSKRNTLINNLNNLNISAELILQKKAADSFKISIQDLFSKISYDNAVKFLSEDYEHLKIKLNHYLTLDDKQILDEFGKIQVEICALNNSVQEKYTKWKNERDLLLDSSIRLKNELNNYSVDNPITNENISIFEFENLYLRKQSKVQFDDGILKIHELIVSDQFEQAQKSLNEFEVNLIELKKECTEQSIILKKNIAITRDTIVALESLNYNINANTITDNPMDGFKIVCSAGDELVEFVPVFNNNGEIKYDINHIMRDGTEAVNCSISIRDIYNSFQSQGIPIVDIKKNEKSLIHNKKTAVKQQETDKMERSRK